MLHPLLQTSPTEAVQVVIIGGGPGGIVALKEVVAAGLRNVTLLEKADSIGGLFALGYDSLRLTSSAPISMFSDFPIPTGQGNHFWTKAEVLSYWSDYNDHFGLRPFIRLNQSVQGLRPMPESGWCMDVESHAEIRAAAVIVATGNNVAANLPDWHGQITAIPTLHSGPYRNPGPFSGKNVVIVGGGESAADITLEIARRARTCAISLRNGPGWIVPRHRGTVAADLSTHRAFWTLPPSTGRITGAMLLRAGLVGLIHDVATLGPARRRISRLRTFKNGFGDEHAYSA